MNDHHSPFSLKKHFDTNGFVEATEFIRGSELTELLSNVDRFIQTVVPLLSPEQVFYEDKQNPATLKQIQQMGEHDPWFADLFNHGRFRELAEVLLDGSVVPKNMQYFNKPPSVGQPTPPHQDGHYFMLEPCEAVTMWLALDEVDEENGCVRYVSGSHVRGMREHAKTNTLGFSQGIVEYPSCQDLEDEIACPAMPGDLLAHHAMTIHRADANQSPLRHRRALGFIYYSERAKEDTVTHQAYQRNLSAEMKKRGKI